MLPCDKLKLDVRRFSNFSSTELTNPLDANGNLKTKFSYDPGQRRRRDRGQGVLCLGPSGAPTGHHQLEQHEGR